MLPTNIKTVDDVRKFFHHVIFEEHTNVNPDTPFSDYVEDDGKKSYTVKEAKLRDRLLNQCHEQFPNETYTVGLEELQEFTKANG